MLNILELSTDPRLRDGRHCWEDFTRTLTRMQKVSTQALPGSDRSHNVRKALRRRQTRPPSRTPSDVDNPILLEAGGITLTVTPEHIVPVIAAA